MRIFAALDLPDEVHHQLAVWWTEASILLPACDWRDVPERSWHLTLAFYGEVDGNELDDLAEALNECADSVSPLELRTAGFGVFPDAARPRAFWAGVEPVYGGRELKHLARCCRQAGHVTLRKHTARETPFRGHVTLARALPDAVAVDARIRDELPEMPDIAWSAGTVGLYASQLRPQGPIYRLVEAFELKGNQHVR